MEILEIIGSVLLLITSILIIIFVLAQNSGSDGMGALSGSSDSLSGARDNSNEAKAARITKILAVVFFVLSLAVWVIGIVK